MTYPEEEVITMTIDRIGMGMYGISGYQPLATGKAGAVEDTKPVVNPGESMEVAPGRKSSPAECETCRER